MYVYCILTLTHNHRRSTSFRTTKSKLAGAETTTALETEMWNGTAATIHLAADGVCQERREAITRDQHSPVHIQY